MTALNSTGTPTGTPRKKGPAKKGADSAPATPKKRGASKQGQSLEKDSDLLDVKKEEIEPTTADEADGDESDESDDVKVPTPKRNKKEFGDEDFF